jgi:hypothetical protein
VTDERVSATRTIGAPAAGVFAVLADPGTHAAVDAGHRDGDYRIANEVIVFDRPRAIGWRPGTEGSDGGLEFGGWTWRYDLAPLGASTTEVTLTYDWSAVPPRIREYLQFPPFGPGHLANSLSHLAGLAAPDAPGPGART